MGWVWGTSWMSSHCSTPNLPIHTLQRYHSAYCASLWTGGENSRTWRKRFWKQSRAKKGIHPQTRKCEANVWTNMPNSSVTGGLADWTEPADWSNLHIHKETNREIDLNLDLYPEPPPPIPPLQNTSSPVIWYLWQGRLKTPDHQLFTRRCSYSINEVA